MKSENLMENISKNFCYVKKKIQQPKQTNNALIKKEKHLII